MLEWLAEVASNDSIVGKSLLTLLLFAGFYFVRLTSLRLLRTRIGEADRRRRWVVGIRNANILLFFLLTAAVWASELRTFALSLVAIAAAIAISMKEFIQCLVGSFYRSSSRLYSVGDRIEVGVHRGDVIDINLLSTTILEVGPRAVTHQQTGRSITIPNALLLVEAIVNETYSHNFVLHTFTVPVAMKDDWTSAPQRLLSACNEECKEFLPKARHHFRWLGQHNALDVPNPAPRVTIQISKPDEVTMVARIPVPARQKGRVEQRILQKYLSIGTLASESTDEFRASAL